MRYISWTLIAIFWVILGGVLYYTLPAKDIVRIVNTYEERQDLNDWTRIFWSRPDNQSDILVARDVQFIQTVRADGSLMVYRNEDTGWSWPPYFKFDTANLYTEANDAVSTKAVPEWYIVKHYGWRVKFLSTFPNAISIRPVAGPDASKGIPWVNIVILLLLAAFFYAMWARWRRFRKSQIDPLIEKIQDNWEIAKSAINEKLGRFR
ncbi:MAG: DUF1523 family protein [Tateyamaria sp.]|jgi:hypothetical protein|nr:DUF1523 family protein [Tateyamaria sp.]HAB40041.1 DUF1523 domain-containing protein [Paracoccaceae bacterium]MBT5303295.1 DUF1523 family protein [Tateyamaria sp.]MBT6268411.1 DUF1523 family protein [Tateyamaria sp.]MBT6341811.1 DUF1523 family protein [Tateyamaria sp.]